MDLLNLHRRLLKADPYPVRNKSGLCSELPLNKKLNISMDSCTHLQCFVIDQIQSPAPTIKKIIN